MVKPILSKYLWISLRAAVAALAALLLNTPNRSGGVQFSTSQSRQTHRYAGEPFSPAQIVRVSPSSS